MPIQNRGTFLWMVIIGLLKLATFQLQDRMFSSFSAQSLKRYGHFSDLKVEIALISITAMLKNVNFFFWGGETSTGTAIHDLGEIVTASNYM